VLFCLPPSLLCLMQLLLSHFPTIFVLTSTYAHVMTLMCIIGPQFKLCLRVFKVVSGFAPSHCQFFVAPCPLWCLEGCIPQLGVTSSSTRPSPTSDSILFLSLLWRPRMNCHTLQSIRTVDSLSLKLDLKTFCLVHRYRLTTSCHGHPCPCNGLHVTAH